MVTDQQCVDYARECVRLAELTKDLQLRDWLLTTAREWMATAETKRSRAGIVIFSIGGLAVTRPFGQSYIALPEQFQMSTCSAMASASSTSIPRYLTVLSILVWPSNSCTARRLPVRR